MKFFVSLFSLPFFIVTVLAHADTRAVYNSPDGEFIIEYRDDNHIRFSMADDGFMLISSGKAYVLMRENNQWTAIPASSMTAMMPSAKSEPEQTRIKPLGIDEMIAGFRGERFQVEIKDAWSGDWQKQNEVVLSTDSATLPTTRAMMRLASTFSGMEKTNLQNVEGVNINQYGFLADDEMRLNTIETKTLPDSVFQLPSGTQIRQMPSVTMGAGQGQDTEGESSQNFLNELFESVQDEAANETKEGTKQGVGDAVREGLRDFFN